MCAQVRLRASICLQVQSSPAFPVGKVIGGQRVGWWGCISSLFVAVDKLIWIEWEICCSDNRRCNSI